MYQIVRTKQGTPTHIIIISTYSVCASIRISHEVVRTRTPVTAVRMYTASISVCHIQYLRVPGTGLGDQLPYLSVVSSRLLRK